MHSSTRIWVLVAMLGGIGGYVLLMVSKEGSMDSGMNTLPLRHEGHAGAPAGIGADTPVIGRVANPEARQAPEPSPPLSDAEKARAALDILKIHNPERFGDWNEARWHAEASFNVGASFKKASGWTFLGDAELKALQSLGRGKSIRVARPYQEAAAGEVTKATWKKLVAKWPDLHGRKGPAGWLASPTELKTLSHIQGLETLATAGISFDSHMVFLTWHDTSDGNDRRFGFSVDMDGNMDYAASTTDMGFEPSDRIAVNLLSISKVGCLTHQEGATNGNGDLF